MPGKLFALHAETSLHPGAGASADIVDLPVQREAHTGYPCIFGSSLKGAWRDKARAEGMDDDTLKAIFGPEPGGTVDHGGALLPGDARLLLLPFRSQVGQFRWVTCHYVLKRLARDAERLGIGGFKDMGHTRWQVDDEKAWVADQNGDIFLEEFSFKAFKDEELADVAAKLAELSTAPGFGKDLARQIMVTSDGMFADLVRLALPVNPHISLDSATKTNTTGALWYEETLPPETLLYACVESVPAIKPVKLDDTEVMVEALEKLFAERPYLRIGGNETTGMGWCRVCWQ